MYFCTVKHSFMNQPLTYSITQLTFLLADMYTHLRQRKGPRNRPKLLRLTVLQLRLERVAERGPDE